ncbi:MAG: hypothetical protein KJZ96_12170 [Rhodocyclaceae bacterium]|nr:hypothetical protein [Rhodocyclaceae bacterium]
MNFQDIGQALSSAIRARAGHPVAHPHPDTEQFHDAPLSTAARAVAEVAIAHGRMRTPASPQAVLGMGLNSADFGLALSTAMRDMIHVSYQAAAEHLSFCKSLPASSFAPQEFLGADADLTLDAVPEGSEFKAARIHVDGQREKATLATYGKNVSITRQTIANDDLDSLTNFFGGLGVAASRKEAQMIYTTLEGNPTLADGEAMFHADHGNIVSLAFGEAALGDAVRALRQQPTKAGNLANLRPAVLLVASDIEFAARKIVHESGMAVAVTAAPHRPVEVVGSAWLPTGRFYLFASPDVAPAIGRLFLKGSGDTSIIVGPGLRPENYDGQILGVRADLGVLPLGRVGVIRGGV